MKGSINPGGLKNLSASQLRAWSGTPRCQMVGSLDIIYDCDIIYSANGTMSISPPFGGGFPNPPDGMPYGKWSLQITSVVNLTVPFSARFSMAQRVALPNHGPYHQGTGDRFLVTSNTFWERVILAEFLIGDVPYIAYAGYDNTWIYGSPTNGIAFGFGPDLLTLATLDLNSPGTVITQSILPEQNETCIYQFWPFMFSDSLVQGRGGTYQASAWISGANGAGQFQGWGILGMPQNLYPNGTKLGTLQFRFRRISNTPLFAMSIAPPRKVTFTNETLFNPSLVPIWDWDFGDGSGHVATFSPSHNYPSTGKYNIKLKSTDASGVSKTFDQILIIPLIADFTYTTRLSFHVTPVTQVLPVDASIGAVTWDWDWGDGSAHATTQAIPFPGHEYPRGQTFTITLTVGDGAGKTASKAVVIHT